MIFLQPLFRALLAISGLSYLVSATLGNILFDLMGDSLNARSYYCSTLEAAAVCAAILDGGDAMAEYCQVWDGNSGEDPADGGNADTNVCAV